MSNPKFIKVHGHIYEIEPEPPKVIKVGNVLYKLAALEEEEMGDLARLLALELEKKRMKHDVEHEGHTDAVGSLSGFLNRLSYLGTIAAKLLTEDYGSYSLKDMTENGPSENPQLTQYVKNVVDAMNRLVSFSTTGHSRRETWRHDELTDSPLPPYTPRKIPEGFYAQLGYLPRALRVYRPLITAWEELVKQAPDWWFDVDYWKGQGTDPGTNREFQKDMSKFHGFLTGLGSQGVGVAGAKVYHDRLEKYIEELEKISEKVQDPEGYASTHPPISQEHRDLMRALSDEAINVLMNSATEEQISRLLDVLSIDQLENLARMEATPRERLIKQLMGEIPERAPETEEPTPAPADIERMTASVRMRCASTDGKFKIPAWRVEYQGHAYQYHGLV